MEFFGCNTEVLPGSQNCTVTNGRIQFYLYYFNEVCINSPRMIRICCNIIVNVPFRIGYVVQIGVILDKASVRYFIAFSVYLLIKTPFDDKKNITMFFSFYFRGVMPLLFKMRSLRGEPNQLKSLLAGLFSSSSLRITT